MSRNIIISTTTFGKFSEEPIEMLEKAGFTVHLNPHNRKLTESEIKSMLLDADVLIAGTEPLSRDVLKSAERLKVISRCGVGMDNIDLTAADEFGIKVLNTPYGPTLAVAELTVGLILCLLRKVSQMDNQIRNGKWNKMMGSLLFGKRVGIIGFGRIGQKVAGLLIPFGVEIGYCDVNSVTCTLDCNTFDHEPLLSWADIITVHLSPTSCEQSIIGENELKKMKKGAWLINMSRGGVVNEQALIKFLKNGHLAGAALDAFDHEPYYGPLSEVENVILTPHVGSYAKEARVEMELQAARNGLQGFNESVQ